MNQRWRNGRSYMVPDDLIDTSRYEVVELRDDNTPKRFVEEHHYSRSYPAARIRFGLYEIKRAILEGVAVFSHPPSEDVLAKLPCERMAGIELGRFILLDSVKGNGESWFLGQCFEGLRKKGIECLLSHSDPLPRRTQSGEIVMPGHIGRIYQATNAIYAGRSRAHKLCMLPDGTVFSERSISKIRSAERGWERDVQVLVGAGANHVTELVAGGTKGDPRYQARRDWVWHAISQVCRRVPHQGNHRYLWAIDKKLRREVAKLATGEKYPKQVDEIREVA